MAIGECLNHSPFLAFHENGPLPASQCFDRLPLPSFPPELIDSLQDPPPGRRLDHVASVVIIAGLNA